MSELTLKISDPEILKKFIGMTLDEGVLFAKKDGFDIRIFEDEHPRPCTFEYCFKRINFYSNKKIIYECNFG